MKTQVALPFALTALLTAGSMSVAQSNDAFDDVITAEVLPGWTLADGSRMAGLRITLAPGWKTYWRAPGDAGIPPQFDWSGSRNLGTVELTWPQPRVFHENGMRSIGYKEQVVIPLHIAPKSAGKPVRIKGRMDLGVCSDICMPHTLKFNATLEGDAAQPTPAIAAAMASAPYSAKEAKVRKSTCAISPTAQGMKVEARITMPSAGGREVAVIESGVSGVWVSEPEVTRTGGDIVAVSSMIHPDGGPFSLNRSAIRITVLGANYAVDIKGCTAG
jgi:DsbC/DsbD-like thiol-disulfide interchange protein